MGKSKGKVKEKDVRKGDKKHHHEDPHGEESDDQQSVSGDDSVASHYTANDNDEKFSMYETESVFAKEGKDLDVVDYRTVETFSSGVEDLNEKKSATRVAGLKKILKSLQSGFDISETVLSTIETLSTTLARILRKMASEDEGIYSAKVLSIIAFCVGPEGNEFFDTFDSILRTIVSSSTHESVRIQSVKALAMISYICSSDSSATWHFIQTIATKDGSAYDNDTESEFHVSPALQAAALEAWSLLATTMSVEDILYASKGGIFEAANDLLVDSNTENKVAAGETLALLYEIINDAEPNHPPEESGHYLCDDRDAILEALSRLADVWTKSSKQIAKKDKKERKSAMKVVLDYITEQIAPYEKISFQGADVEVDTFAKIRVLSAIREVMQDGFQAALVVFPLVRDILEIEYFDSNSVIQAAHVSKKGVQGKQRYVARRQERGYRQKQNDVYQGHA